MIVNNIMISIGIKMFKVVITTLLLSNVFFNQVGTNNTFTIEAGSCNLLENPNSCKGSCLSISHKYGYLTDYKCTLVLLATKCVCYFENDTAITKTTKIKIATMEISKHFSGHHDSGNKVSSLYTHKTKWPKMISVTTITPATNETKWSKINSTTAATATHGPAFSKTSISTFQQQMTTIMITSNTTSPSQHLNSSVQSVANTDVIITTNSSIHIEDELTTRRRIAQIQNNVAIISGLAASFVGVILTGVIICKTVPFCQGPTMFEFVPTIM